MAAVDNAPQVSVEPIERPLNLIPVGLKEAALDSPTFRATSVHFAEQVDAVERWLEGYIKATTRLTTELAQFEAAVNGFLAQCTAPTGLSEAIFDHDYASFAIRKFGEGTRELWAQQFKSTRRYELAIVEPIRSFLYGEVRSFKEARRVLELSQKNFDTSISRYLGQSKIKEASSLREDAFQLHEARKAYLKASLDYSVAGPQLKDSLDKLIVGIFADQWKESRLSREKGAPMLSKVGNELERVRGWSREMESSERAFQRELIEARKKIEDNASQMIKPSRELADYEPAATPYLGASAKFTAGPPSPSKQTAQARDEKQGWLFMKTVVGKPARTVWSRRWFFVKGGIFGWLVQGTRAGGVGESEKIGVLLCGVKPALQEERRFCFEVKTKDTSIILQAETQAELSDWIASFEVVKRKALSDPTSVETSPLSPGVDPAFAITPPISQEFAVKQADGAAEQRTDDTPGALAVPTGDVSGLGTRASFDVASGPRVRVSCVEKEPESSRDHAARIIQKLDLHKRSAPAPATLPSVPMGGGIAGLISASQNLLPTSPVALSSSPNTDISNKSAVSNYEPSSLTPSTLANPPAPTNLSHTAVLVSSERGLGLGGRADGSGMPGGIMANLWGSSNWGFVNRLATGLKVEQKPTSASTTNDAPQMSSSVDDVDVMDGMNDNSYDAAANVAVGLEPIGAVRHRKAMSSASTAQLPSPALLPAPLDAGEEYPSFYPLQLKAQHAQFRVLFPTVPRSEKLVLVFRATWNPNEQQEFPGRVYVTERDIYFYSHHLGLVLTTGVALNTIAEVTSAPGRDCDFLYLLLKHSGRQDERQRITIRIFLEPLRLLQHRLSFLVTNANSPEPANLEAVVQTLLQMQTETVKRSSSAESWEDITYEANDIEPGDESSPARQRQKNIKARVRIDGNLYGDVARTGREVQKFQLPRHPVVYAPPGMHESTKRDFNVSAKALFHVVFGDKSIVFQLLYNNRWADKVIQTPWVKPNQNPESRWTRQFSSQGNLTPMADTQTIDVMNDHLCYVVTHYKRPWRLPYSKDFAITTKLVITHSAKSKSRLAVFQNIAWHKTPLLPYVKNLVEKQALNSLEADALDLTTVAMDQVAKLESQSKTNKAIEIFGNIGGQPNVTQFDASAIPNLGGSAAAARQKARKPVGIMSLILSDLMMRVISMLNMFFDIIVALIKGAGRVFTTHTLLVAVLAVSALYNSWHGYRDTLTWWHEKNAGQYMARLGVRMTPTISRAIYLHDIEAMFQQQSNLTFAPPDQDRQNRESSRNDVRTCRTTFSDLLSSSAFEPDISGSSNRLYRSRDALARRRNDLMVAMRVVNRMEKDLVTAEWENWLRREHDNCVRVEKMLHRHSHPGNDKRARADKALRLDAAKLAELDSELGEEFAQYCASCRAELDEIRDSAGRLI